jgi:uncharacterized membrane protein
LDGENEPMQLLNHVWNHFDFKWNTFVTVLSTYQAVFWIMLGGFIMHWLPEKIKNYWEQVFAKLPIVVQAISVAVILFFVYQAVSDTFKPFVYFQF